MIEWLASLPEWAAWAGFVAGFVALIIVAALGLLWSEDKGIHISMGKLALYLFGAKVAILPFYLSGNASAWVLVIAVPFYLMAARHVWMAVKHREVDKTA